MLGDEALADDVVQETFLRASRFIHVYDPKRPIYPWLLTISRRVAIDVARSRARAEGRDAWYAARAQPVATGDAPFEAACRTEERQRLARALSRLPARQRRALLLRGLDGFTYEEIAAIEGVSVQTVKSLLQRARAAAREALDRQPWLGTALYPFGHVFSLARSSARQCAARLRARAPTIEQWIRPDAAVLLSQLGAALVAISTIAGTTLPPAPASSAGMDASVSATATRHVREAAGHAATKRVSVEPAYTSQDDAWSPRIGTNVLDPARAERPESTWVTAIDFSPAYQHDRTVFVSGKCSNDFIALAAGASCSVLWISKDGGATWVMSPASGRSFHGQRNLAFAPGYPVDRRIWALGDKGLEQSDDGGISFRLVSPIQGTSITAVASDSGPRVLIAGWRVWVYNPRTGATTPYPLPTTELGHDSHAAFSTRGNTALFGRLERRFTAEMTQERRPLVSRCVATDCTSTILPRGVVAPNVYIAPDFEATGSAFAVSYTENVNLYRSSDGGQSFHEVQIPAGLRQRQGLTSIKWTSAADPPLWVMLPNHSRGTQATVLVWEVGAPAWQTIAVDVPGASAVARDALRRSGVMGLAISPSGRMFATLAIGLACSEDRGRTWHLRCTPER